MTDNCQNCNEAVTNNYCSYCGQKRSVHRYSIKHFIEHDLIHGIWHVDSGILFTLKALFKTPGHSVRKFIQGKRIGYFNFFTLLLLILGVGHYISQYSQIELADIMPASSKGIMIEFEAFSKKYPKIILVLTIPFYSFFSYLWFKKSKLNLTEHFVLNSYKTAAESIIALLFTIITVFYNNITGLRIIYSLISLSTFIYSIWFYYQFFSGYNFSKIGLFLRSVAVLLSYIFFYSLVGVIVGILSVINK